MGKRRRPKRRTSEEEQVEDEGDSGHLPPTAHGGDLHHQPPDLSSPPQGSLSALRHNSSLNSRYPTRQSKRLLCQFSTLMSPLRKPIRNVSGAPSQSSTLRPTRGVLAEAMDQPSPATSNTSEKSTSELPPQTRTLRSHGLTPSPLAYPEVVTNSAAASSRCPNQVVKKSPSHNGSSKLAKMGKTERNYNSASEGSEEDWSIPKSNELEDLENLTSKFLDQTQRSEDHPNASPVAANEVLTDNHLTRKEANMASDIIRKRAEESTNNVNQKDKHLRRCASLNFTEIVAILADDSSDPDEVGSAFDPALVTVNGYRVKEEMASVLRSIFSKYGDIAKGSTFQTIYARSTHLEMVCGIYQKLERTESTNITLVELKSMLGLVGDLESVGLEMGWLHQRLDEISEALRFSAGYNTLKEAQRRNLQEIERNNDELKMLQEKVCLAKDKRAALDAEAEKINETILESKAKMRCFYEKPLVDGLL